MQQITRTKEHFYEVLKTQLAAHIDYDTACGIANAYYEGNVVKANEIIQAEVNISDLEKVNRIVERIRQIFAKTTSEEVHTNGYPQAK